MKGSISFFILAIAFLMGCTSEEVSKKEVNKETALPLEISNTVNESDIQSIDWNNTATSFNTGTRSDMVGNKLKIGIIAPELKAKKIDKWMWHFWGIKEGKLMIVGYNKKSSTVSPVLYDVDSKKNYWTKDGLGSEVNGADSHIPSNVLLNESGKWAFLVYIDNELFDILVMDLK
ncbi:hypothetical protein ABE65_012135 [Fictibacillus phosphorivorans]|uniref:DUF4871 domain-containing protein n=1 Tax=Fictibacillus phosphorivorans TaxID=1221500 RepID=A0A160INC9_9BACL|nr:DUF4871 domain-containing protein [Fictibacillus phosphorivorans]ANC77506.1 hypothetical protein ABE65_012135 [Fictibacillus phosphorivorans]